jgi:hypothetical protein
MGKSQQLGWIVLKGKRWYGYAMLTANAGQQIVN